MAAFEGGSIGGSIWTGPRREESFRWRAENGQDMDEGKQEALRTEQWHVKKEEWEMKLQTWAARPWAAVNVSLRNLNFIL